MAILAKVAASLVVTLLMVGLVVGMANSESHRKETQRLQALCLSSQTQLGASDEATRQVWAEGDSPLYDLILVGEVSKERALELRDAYVRCALRR